MAIAIPTMPKVLPRRDVVGCESPFSAWMKHTEATRYSITTRFMLMGWLRCWRVRWWSGRGFRLAAFRGRFLLEHLEHPAGDEETAEDVDGGKRHGEHAHRLAEARFRERRREHGPDDDDRGDGVGHRHQRRMQGRRDVPDDVVADVDRQDEDDQVDDRDADSFHGSASGGLGMGREGSGLAQDLALVRDEAGLDDVVLEVDVELAFLVDDQLQEIEHV